MVRNNIKFDHNTKKYITEYGHKFTANCNFCLKLLYNKIKKPVSHIEY